MKKAIPPERRGRYYSPVHNKDMELLFQLGSGDLRHAHHRVSG
jgi:hypothetical protein